MAQAPPAWAHLRGPKRIAAEFKACSSAESMQAYDFAVVADSLFKWRFKLRNFDDDLPGGQQLNADLAELQRRHGMDHLLMEVAFPNDYPTHPFFMRMVKPRCVMYTGHVTAGGSICIEALTLSGSEGSWRPDYCVESILQVVIANMQDCETVYIETPTGPGGCTGPLRIDLHGNRGSPMREYTEAEAQAAFRRMESYHSSNGWGDSPGAVGSARRSSRGRGNLAGAAGIGWGDSAGAADSTRGGSNGGSGGGGAGSSRQAVTAAVHSYHSSNGCWGDSAGAAGSARSSGSGGSGSLAGAGGSRQAATAAVQRYHSSNGWGDGATGAGAGTADSACTHSSIGGRSGWWAAGSSGQAAPAAAQPLQGPSTGAGSAGGDGGSLSGVAPVHGHGQLPAPARSSPLGLPALNAGAGAGGGRKRTAVLWKIPGGNASAASTSTSTSASSGAGNGDTSSAVKPAAAGCSSTNPSSVNPAVAGRSSTYPPMPSVLVSLLRSRQAAAGAVRSTGTEAGAAANGGSSGSSSSSSSSSSSGSSGSSGSGRVQAPLEARLKALLVAQGADAAIVDELLKGGFAPELLTVAVGVPDVLDLLSADEITAQLDGQIQQQQQHEQQGPVVQSSVQAPPTYNPLRHDQAAPGEGTLHELLTEFDALRQQHDLVAAHCNALEQGRAAPAAPAMAAAASAVASAAVPAAPAAMTAVAPAAVPTAPAAAGAAPGASGSSPRVPVPAAAPAVASAAAVPTLPAAVPVAYGSSTAVHTTPATASVHAASGSSLRVPPPPPAMVPAAGFATPAPAGAPGASGSSLRVPLPAHWVPMSAEEQRSVKLVVLPLPDAQHDHQQQTMARSASSAVNSQHLSEMIYNGVPRHDAIAALAATNNQLGKAFEVFLVSMSQADAVGTASGRSEGAGAGSSASTACNGHEGQHGMEDAVQAEVAHVLAEFERTMGAAGFAAGRGRTVAVVKRIERVQNWRLLSKFELHSEEVAEQRGRAALNQEELWHGTRSLDNMLAICREGFDHRLSNLNGSLGGGTYFAKQASYSHTYAATSCRTTAAAPFDPWGGSVAAPRVGRFMQTFGQPPAGLCAGHVWAGECAMLLCKVTLGRIGRGAPQLRCPPRGYDSVSASGKARLEGGAITCVFDNAQAYPMYIVHYDWTPASRR